ncbi:fungal-specific transcription factor domain-containing protein [Daldinia decipiens]|uniref:fungal-specific transcription factor domain-containing protein n=1 Tax=Daldinia decipiens TaxID=326647 RepID=UPI0020C24CB8|nr:fungal-specific transcription factor domain-containing protein [Daldinia decipiens]KAI1652860.1 fungal-specific transcription factor domain-containing protein [Daldinia decipiens]
MDLPENTQQSDGLARSGKSSWTPDLPHHFLQPGPGVDPTVPGFGPGLPLLGQHDGLSHLASAAAISDPYSMLPGTSPLGPSPLTQAGPSAFIANENTALGTSTENAERREQLRARRRVPNSQRKRTQVSCDACKTRRCKCVRLKAAPGSDDDMAKTGGQPPCKLCVETGISCVTSLPRKQRVYGSVENLDKRYRALEALVSGIFPELNPRASAEELVIFGQERAIAMPDFGESPDQSQSQPQFQSVEHHIKPVTPQTHRYGSVVGEGIGSSNLIMAGTDDEKTILPPSYLMRFAPTRTPQLSPDSTDSVADPSAKITGLISDATGRPHYIGPCGSLAFFGKMRELFVQRFSEAGIVGGSEGAIRGFASGKKRLFHNNPLAASLGGIGDRGRAAASPPRRDSSSSPSQILDHLDGDSPPQICEHMLREHPNDPEFWRYRKRVSELELPPKERADACVDAFFQCVHPNFTLFHRLTHQTAYEKMWRCWDAHRGKKPKIYVKETSVSVGWLCCLYMILILGSRSLPQTAESLDFQRKWFSKVEELPPLLSTSSLPNVRAYMLLSLYYHNTNDRTGAWTFHGAACRLAIALGMHRESSSGLFDPVERQLRKLAWWTLYGYEQFLCCSLGRPSAIDDREMDVGIPNDDYLDANLLPPRYIEHSARLDMLLAAVRRGIFDPGFVPGKMYARALEFLETVSGWEDTLPRGLKPLAYEGGSDGNDNQWRSAILLNVRYHHTLCFLTRPFLFETIESVNGGSPLGPDACKIRALCKVCLTGAMRCGNLIIDLWRAGHINGATWIDIYYAYMSSLDISLALLSPDSLYQDEDQLEIAKPELIQSYAVEEMRDVVRQLCEVMSTIEAAFDLLSLGLSLLELKARERDKGPSEEKSTHDKKQGVDGDRVDQGMTGISSYYPAGAMNLDFQGNLSYPLDDAMGDVQWDM